MLIGYYMGDVSRQDLFGQLEDEQKFAVSPLHGVPLSRLGMLTEAYFYDALLAQAKGMWRAGGVLRASRAAQPARFHRVCYGKVPITP